MDEKTINGVDKLKETVKETVNVIFEDSKRTFFCPVCVHKEVCKKITEVSKECENFIDATGPQRYSSIYHFFRPIFDWIKFHYPAGEVKFIVDHNSARMYIEHGPAVFSNEINNFASNVQNVENGNSEIG